MSSQSKCFARGISQYLFFYYYFYFIFVFFFFAAQMRNDMRHALHLFFFLLSSVSSISGVGLNLFFVLFFLSLYINHQDICLVLLCVANEFKRNKNKKEKKKTISFTQLRVVLHILMICIDARRRWGGGETGKKKNVIILFFFFFISNFLFPGSLLLSLVDGLGHTLLQHTVQICSKRKNIQCRGSGIWRRARFCF